VGDLSPRSNLGRVEKLGCCDGTLEGSQQKGVTFSKKVYVDPLDERKVSKLVGEAVWLEGEETKRVAIGVIGVGGVNQGTCGVQRVEDAETHTVPLQNSCGLAPLIQLSSSHTLVKEVGPTCEDLVDGSSRSRAEGDPTHAVSPIGPSIYDGASTQFSLPDSEETIS